MNTKNNRNNKKHWENIYRAKKEQEVGWFEPYPKTSIQFIELFRLPKNANIIDVGGGDGHLVDVLLEKEYQNIWVLDISKNAIERARQRLKEKAFAVHWIVSDIVDFIPPVKFDLWHDRAAFHFLTTEEKIYNYVSVAEDSIEQNGYLVLGTFSEQGPKNCSGLEIKQYSEASLSTSFEVSFERIKCIREDHITPFNTVQNFLFCSFKKK